jgi:hypothetical protein
MRKPTHAPEPPWVVTLFAPPALRVSPEEYAHLLRDAALRRQLPPLYRLVPLAASRRPLAARLRACRQAWARRGWWPYDRSARFGWGPGDLGYHPVNPEEEDEA